MNLGERARLRLPIVLVVGVVIVIVLLSWVVSADAQPCRWSVQVWDGESVRAGAVEVPCGLSEAEVRQELHERPPDLELVDGADWDADLP